MEAPQIDLVRALPPAAAPELRADSNGDGRLHMVGHFSVFNTWYEVNSIFEGRFLERIAPGAFKETIRDDLPSVKVTFNHGHDVLGDQVLGDIVELAEDERGARYDVALFRSVPDLIIEGLQAGVYGSSFRFRVVADEWDDNPGESAHNPLGLKERTITKVRLMEFGPVTYPANPEATAGLRSLTDQFYDGLRSRNPSVYEAACRAAQIPTGRPDTRSAGGGGADTDAGNAEVSPDPQPNAATHPPAPSQQERTVENTTLTVEERVARQAEIRARLAEIDAEHNGAELPEDVRSEWDRLEAEYDEHERHIADARRRQERLARMAQNDGNTERAGARDPYEPSGGTSHTRSPRYTEDIYDLTELRRRARSLDDLAGLLRQNALRAVERASFPVLERRGADRRVVRNTREDAQTQVEHLLNFVDDEAGSLARRILVTGSPLYERAFGKALAKLSTIGLTAEEQRALSLGTDSAGGFAVPFQLDPTVILTSNGVINPLRQIARVEQIVGKEWQGVTSAGITVSRVAEGTEASDDAPTLAQPTVRAQRVQGFVPFSIEIDQDWAGLRAEMTRLLADAKDEEEANSFVNGNGTGTQANGVIGTLGTGSNVTANTFTSASIYQLEEALPPRFRARAAFLANRSIYNLARQFDTAGGADLWVRLGDGLPPELIGYPAYEVSTMVSGPPDVGDRYLLFGDFSQFLIVDRVGMSVELVPHLFGSNQRPTGQRGIYAVWRNNSLILTDNAFRVLHKAA